MAAQSESPAHPVRQSWVAGSHVNGAQSTGAQSSQRPAVSQRLSPVTMPAAHVGWPQSVPDGRGEQLPSRPVRLHAMQTPSQAVLQQTPCAQWLLAHCPSLTQVARGGRMQLSFMQGVPVQSASVVQLVRQVAVAGSQRKGTQILVGLTRQTRWPSHVSVPTTASPWQLPPKPHGVPLGRTRHAPVPSHSPSYPQVRAASIGHPSGVFGGSPSTRLTHDPAMPGTSQCRQGSSHATLQQTPSVQKPLAQSAAVVHCSPSVSGRGVPRAPPVPVPPIPAPPLPTGSVPVPVPPGSSVRDLHPIANAPRTASAQIA